MIPPPSASGSSSSSSGPSSERTNGSDAQPQPGPSGSRPNLPANHPLLPPTQAGKPKIYAAELDYYAMYRKQYRETHPAVESPEKCFTFCSQRADAPPLCRMFCLRKRQVALSQKEELARLRPQKRFTSPVHDQAAATSKTPQAGVSGSTSEGWLPDWAPLEALRKRIEPYSFIYVRGTPDGVVGRYMEELESDDGQYDFSTVSRGAGALAKRKREELKMEWMDWGENGALLHMPFTSVFHPILALPGNLKRIFSPGVRLLGMYRDSFTDGSQVKGLQRLQKEVEQGSAFKFLGKVQTHWEKRVKEEEEKRLEKMRKDMDGKRE